MRKVLVLAFVVALVGGALTPAAADYYRTKSDFRQGKAVPGYAPPKAGTPNCTSPTAIMEPNPTFTDTGNTTGAANTIDSIPLACNGNYSQVSGPDHIYQFTVGAGNMLDFTLSTTSQTYDPSIYVLSTCVDANSCVSGADNCFASDSAQPGTCQGTDSTETFMVSGLANGTYFFFIDSFYASDNAARSQGPYSLSVEGDLPVELMEFDVE